MIDKYEAAEMLVIGRAQDVILGIKEIDWPDSTTQPPRELQVETLSVFDE
jgi:hypothetical protein